MRAAKCLACTAVAMVVSTAASAQTRVSKTLDVYVVDVEGGNATLFVGPSGDSLLIDTGNVGSGSVRDAGRIMEAVQDARLQQIDHLITTHWHGDHYGGMAELAARVPIREFIDHGPNVQPGGSVDTFLKDTYPQLYAKSKHTVVKAGDRISMTGLDVRVLTSAGETIKTALSGAGKPNPYCAAFKSGDRPPLASGVLENGARVLAEDTQSIGVYITLGKFRTIHLGDITKNKEFELMCPNNLIGTVDVLLGLHHGVDNSNSPTLIYAVHPRVAIMNNGPRKGGQPEVMQTVHSSPGLEDLWQLHFSLLSGQEYTAPGMFIANTIDDQPPAMPIAPAAAPQPGPSAPPAPAHNGKAYWIKVSAQPDGSFTVTNARNAFTKKYGTAR